MSRPPYREFPLSELQASLWREEQRAPGSHNVNHVLRARSPIDLGAMREAWRAVVGRHEALRTTVHAAEGAEAGAVQRVRDDLANDAAVVDAAGLDDAAFAARLDDEFRRPFDLAREPGAQLILFRRTRDDVVLFWRMHHLIVDLPSCDLLQDELLREYAARVQGRRAVIARPARTYRDFVEQEPAQAQPAAPPATGAPLEHASLVVPLADRETWRELTARFRAERTSTFHGLLALFYAVLYRYESRSTLIVGTPTDGRGDAFEGVVGHFTHLLALRVELDGDASLRTVVQRVAGAIDDARRQPRTPVGSGAPLGVWFALHRMRRCPALTGSMVRESGAAWEAEIENVALRPSPWGPPSPRHGRGDLAFGLAEIGGRLVAEITYSTAVFERAAVRRLAEHYHNAMRAACGSLAIQVGDLELLSPEERREHAVIWNATRTPFDAAAAVHARIADRVSAQPNALAISGPDGAWTYRELDKRAGRIASALRARGIAAGVPCGLCAESRQQFWLGALAIWRAGGAYVPIDPRNPDAWLRYVVEDSRAPVALVSSALAPRFERLGVPIVASEPAAATAYGRLPSEPAHADQLASIIYTSGSTGAPRGVAVAHRSLMNFIEWYRKLCELGPADRTTVILDPAFDSAAIEIWPAWLAGASAHVPPDATRTDPRALLRWLADTEGTVSMLPAALLEAVLREPWPAGAALRVLATGGDVLRRRPRADVTARVIQLYGPTETTGAATAAVVEPEPARGLPPIGRPIANVQAYVLDERGGLAPRGAIGELHIGGEGVARGYWRRPELTLERFVPDRFSGALGARLYRTGDLVRQREDGALAFVGRRTLYCGRE